MNMPNLATRHLRPHADAARRVALRSCTLGLLGLLFAGCAQDSVAPDTEVSPEARSVAAEQTREILESDSFAQTASRVDDLIGGFDVGIASQTAGLDMELGTGLDGLAGAASQLSVGSQLARADAQERRQREKLVELHRAARFKTALSPGDLLFEVTVLNGDGSQTHTRIFQDDPVAVVRVVQETTWPQGNLLLVSITDEIYVDRGSDLGSEADDVWLSLDSRLDFVGGASLERVVDAREQGGLKDFARVDVVSTWTAAPHHPRLLDAVTTLTVDLGRLDDGGDDRFVSVDRITRLRGTAFDGGAPRVEESLRPESPIAEGEEPCGGEVSRDITFRQDRLLRQWRDRATWACEGGGSLSRRITHADGGVDEVTITEDAAGIVRLDAADRDGTTVTGTYDEAQHRFSLEVLHPEGFDPVRETLSGSTNADETAWQLDAEVVYADEFVEQGHLEGSVDIDGKHLGGHAVNRDGTVDFVLNSSTDDSHLDGYVENDAEQRIDFAVELLPDGGRLLHFDAQEPGRRVVGDLEIGVDGCGNGTLVVTEGDAQASFEISFCDGELDDSPLTNL